MDEIISYKMCAVKVRNAKLRNYLKVVSGNFCCDFRCNFLLLMDVNEWMSYECSRGNLCLENS